MNKIAIIIPAYNEEKRIGKTLEEYSQFFEKLRKEKILAYTLLIIINNTKDRTEEIVKEHQRKNRDLEYLNFKQGGKGFAIAEGFKEALKKDFDLIGFVDADLATPPSAFYDLIRNIGNLDGLIASRWIRGSRVSRRALKNRVLSTGFNFIVRSLFNFTYRDTQCGAKLFKRRVIEEIISDLSLTQWAFDINLLYSCKKKRFIVKEIPTLWEDKTGSKIKPSTPLQMLAGVIRLRVINSSFEPLLKSLSPLVRFLYRKINNIKTK
jgi:glycosyltransferase involved in cell wall biosynthesis